MTHIRDPKDTPMSTSTDTRGDDIRPISATALVDGAEPLAAEALIQRLGQAREFVISTTRPDGRPDAVPIRAVWVDGALHFAARDTTRKARNLEATPQCVLTFRVGGSDLVKEGTVYRVDDPATLDHVVDAYQDTYDSEPDARDGQLWAQGAPSAGPPPFGVKRVEPDTAFAFPAGDAHAPTRWRF